MSLSGLLDLVVAEPQLAGALERTGEDINLIAPPALRPFAVAALARHRPVLAVTATAREAEDLAAALTGLVGEHAVAVSRPGRRCRTSAFRRAVTRSASAWPCCAGWPTPSRATPPPGR